MKKFWIPLLLLGGFLHLGCQEINCCMPGVISVAPNSIFFFGEAPSEEVLVTCSMPWTLLDAPKWLSLSDDGFNGSKLITVTVVGDSDSPRSGAITFMAANGDKATLKVSQNSETVYVAGQENSKAALWLNGSPTILSEEGSAAESVFVKDQTFYVAGYERIEGISYATLWVKNEPPIHLSETVYQSVAHSVYVTDEAIFVVGQNYLSACLWKIARNDLTHIEAIDLSYFPSEAFSVFAYKDVVYAVGGCYARATLWSVTGDDPVISTTLEVDDPSLSSSQATSVFVYNKVVYVAGFYSVDDLSSFSAATLWSNGTAQILPSGPASAGSVFVTQNRILVAGGLSQSTGGDLLEAMLWSNGTPQRLFSTNNALALSVFAAPSGQVYVAGIDLIPTQATPFRALLWIDGVKKTLSSQISIASSVFVQ
ncbi:MAG: BACON domain-containing protein [Bacteroidetes bacterium]|nr:BACON domain-containing protein [Bacteroidota bacterium]